MYQSQSNGEPAFEMGRNISTNNIQVLLMMYDGAIDYLKKAAECTGKEDARRKCRYINKARDIIEEFNNALDIESGGEVARCLRSLYFFMDRHLSKAHWEESSQGMEDVVSMLSNLKESWQYAADSLRGSASQHLPAA